MRTKPPATWHDIFPRGFLIIAAVGMLVLAWLAVVEFRHESECSTVVAYVCRGGYYTRCRVETEAGWRTTTGLVMLGDIVCRRVGDE